MYGFFNTILVSALFGIALVMAKQFWLSGHFTDALLAGTALDVALLLSAVFIKRHVK